jgi:hypothetical protein
MLSLDLCGCRHLSDGAVATAVAAAPELRSLSLVGSSMGGNVIFTPSPCLFLHGESLME